MLIRTPTYRTYGKVSLESQDEWLSILHLATTWSFDDLRILSIDRLGSLPTTSAIDKLLMGRNYDVSHWITEAYVAVCQRDEPLTLAECDKLSVVDIVGINSARHKARVYTGMRPLGEIQSVIDDILEPSPLPALDCTAETPVPPQSAKPPSDPSATPTISGNSTPSNISLAEPPRYASYFPAHQGICPKA